MGIIISVVVGAVCGWLASMLMKSKGGLLFYIFTGILGGFVGSFVFGKLLGIGGGNLLWQIVQGVAGTCILIFLYRLIFDKKK